MMLNPKVLLDVYLKTTSSYTDLKVAAADYTQDPFTLELSTTDYLYIGYDKPINAVYIDITTANIAPNTLSLEYYNGTTWVAIEGLSDDTKGFTRSGFIQWDRNQGATASNSYTPKWAATTVLLSAPSTYSESKYWVRVRPSVNHETGDSGTSVTLGGINLVFSDDQAVKNAFPLIYDEELTLGNTPDGETFRSYIRLQVAARDLIIQKLRNTGYYKVGIERSTIENLTAWDLLDIDEVKQGSVYLVLSMIFTNASDSVDSTWWQKGRYYEEKAEEQLRLAALSIDKDDDGIADRSEMAAASYNRVLSR